MKPYYEDGSVKIYHGDSLEVISSLPFVDAVITDPPYGETSLQWDTWPKGWPQLLMEKTSQLWCFGSFRMFWKQRADFEGWSIAQDIVWEKHNGSSLHADRFRKVHELAVHFYRGEWGALYHAPVFTQDATARRLKRGTKPQQWGSVKSDGIFEAEEGGPRLMRSVIYAKSTHRTSVHPTQKPEAIIGPLMEYSLPLEGTVLDPFCGSGTTLRVAKNLGRKAIGVESNELYCEIAAKRMAQEVFDFQPVKSTGRTDDS